MPVDNGEATARPERVVDNAAQTRFVGNTVKDICHKNEVRWVAQQFQQVVRISRDKAAIHNVILCQTMPRGFEESGLNVDCDNETRAFGHLQSEPAIARAKVNDLHIGQDPYCGHDLVWSWPQSLPPTGCRHLGGLKKACGMFGHLNEQLPSDNCPTVHSFGQINHVRTDGSDMVQALFRMSLGF